MVRTGAIGCYLVKRTHRSAMLPRQLKALPRRYASLLVIALVLVWHSLQYNFVTDDAYISFVFSENLADHGQLVFNHGQHPVEGYTNFLWTFVLGLLMVIGLPPEIMSLVLAAGFAIGTLYLSVRILQHISGGESNWDFLAAALLALSSGFACWTSGGLETQMFTFWVTLAFYAYLRADGDLRYFRMLGVALALAAMTRPEGLLITALVGGHRFLLNLLRDRRLKPNRAELVCLGAFLLIWAPWFAWRAWYYGHLFPNTYYVKAAGEATAGYEDKMHANGRHYIMQWLTQSKLLYAGPAALLALVIAKPRSKRFVYGSLAVLVSAVYIFYTIRVGGDFMGLHRFVMPLFVIGAIGVALALRLLSDCIPNPQVRNWVGPGLALVCAAKTLRHNCNGRCSPMCAGCSSEIRNSACRYHRAACPAPTCCVRREPLSVSPCGQSPRRQDQKHRFPVSWRDRAWLQHHRRWKNHPRQNTRAFARR